MGNRADTADGDRFDLQRFVAAQAEVFERARAELRSGRKRTHWMWFMFPQLRGLGSSPTAVRYAISGLEEAAAYLRHPVLGPRLRELTEIVVGLKAGSVDEVFGYPDNLKFHSSMTLFAPVGEAVFQEALNQYFGGCGDEATLGRLG